MLVHFEALYEQRADVLLPVWGNAAFLRYKFGRLGQSPITIHDLPCAAHDVAVLALYLTPIAPPGPLRLALPLKVRVEQCDRWYSAAPDVKHGHWQVKVYGLPVQMSGSMSLRERADGTALFRVNGHVVARLPGPIGSALERLGCLMIRRTLAQVVEITNAWLELLEPPQRAGTLDAHDMPYITNHGRIEAE